MINIPSLELQTFSDEPLAKFRVNVWRRSLLDRVLGKPAFRDFTIYRTRVVNMGRSAAIAERLNLKGDITNIGDLITVVMPIIHTNKDDVVRLIACCIQNDSKEPSKSLVKFLDENMHADMMKEIVSVCLWNMGLLSFLSATMSIKGTKCEFCLGSGCRSCGNTGFVKKEQEKDDGGIKTIWTGPGNAMHYFHWTYEQIMNMSWDNYCMFLASIPTVKEPSNNESDNEKPAESVDLFNLHG